MTHYDHEIVLKKLTKYGIDQDALKWFKSYLTSRMQRCNVNNRLSSAGPLNCGVPQGSRSGVVATEKVTLASSSYILRVSTFKQFGRSFRGLALDR